MSQNGHAKPTSKKPESNDSASKIPAAMILAAGRGERMRPLTDHTPKPLLQVKGKALIDYHLQHLAEAGVKYVVINVCWLAQMIKDHVGDGTQFGLNVDYSEEATALETAGGIVQALRHFPKLAESDFLLLNADVYCANPLPQLLSQHLANNHGHILLSATPDYLPGDYQLHKGLVQLQQSPNDTLYTYCGMARYSPSWFEGLAEGPQAMRPLLDDAIEQQRLSGSLLNGYWLDVGTPERLKLAESLRPISPKKGDTL